MAANNLNWQSKPAEVIWSVHSSVAASRSLQTRAVQTRAVRSLVFNCEQQLYAIAADQVLEVLETPIVTPVPGSPEWFAGLAVYRAAPVPVVDVGRYFGVGVAPGNEVPIQSEQGQSEQFRSEQVRSEQVRSEQTGHMDWNKKDQKLDRVIAVECVGSRYLLLVNKVLSLTQLPKENSVTEAAIGPTEHAAQQSPYSPYDDVQSNNSHRVIERVCRYEQTSVAVINLPDLLRAAKFLRECFPV